MKKKQTNKKQRLPTKEKKNSYLICLFQLHLLQIREKNFTYVSAYPKKFQQNIIQETRRIMADIKEFKK